MTNGHGDVTEIRDASGNVLNRYTYDIWGNPETTEETVPNVLRYAGEYWDEVTEYLRARWYDPATARFINEDTYEGELTNPLSLNLYTYVSNNPLIHIDPSGHRKEMSPGGGGISPLSRISSSPKISSNSKLVRSSPIKSLNELKDEVRGIQASRTSMATKSSASTKGMGNTSSIRSKGEPYKNHITVQKTDKVRNLPTTGKPNSSVDFYDKNGRLTQRRYYDEKGRVKEDIDYEHSNGDNSHKFPHRHIWDWSSGSPKRSK